MRRVLSLASPRAPQPSQVATAYNAAGSSYSAYADGASSDPFAFDSVHAYADQRVWQVLDALLLQRRATGAEDISILDAGCGPGAWLYRVVARAHALGFRQIRARGFDVASDQVRFARERCRDLAALPGVDLTFDVDDVTRPLQEADRSVDLTLCLYSVISHLPSASHAAVASELARITAGHIVLTVRAVGSTPSAFVDSIENVRRLKQDHCSERCEVEFSDGRRSVFGLHLFTADEIKRRFDSKFEISDLRGLDLFHGRFAPDSRWNPPGVDIDDTLETRLAALEDAFAADPAFRDHAAHLLLVGHRRR